MDVDRDNTDAEIIKDINVDEKILSGILLFLKRNKLLVSIK